MERQPVYLDYNATAVPRPEAVEGACAVMAQVGNPSSVHRAGRRAAAILARARDQVAAFSGIPAANVTFTSGATEANNMVLKGTKAARLIVSAVEHESVLEPARRAGLSVTVVGVDGAGRLDLAALEAALGASGEPTLLSIMAVNNETGVISPYAEIGRLARVHGALFHCDAAQAAGRLDLSEIAGEADFISLSAHKIGGPMGVGALLRGCGEAPGALLSGGGQELGMRAGTENLPGIAGFGIAAEIAGRERNLMARLVELRDALEAEILESAPDVVIPGQNAPRVGNTSAIAMRGMPAETQVMALDLAGIAVSAGSACSSGKVRRSHVLSAMGFDEETAGNAIRVSLGWKTQGEDIARFLAAWREMRARAGLALAEAR
jgi:cysteine desulfurase